MKYIYIKTFGCVQNTADSEKIKAYYWNKGYKVTENIKVSDLVVINTCIIRESAENRAFGLINNLKEKKIVVTGCLSGYLAKNKQRLNELKASFPQVVHWWPIEKFETLKPLRDKKKAALVIISSGCDHFCSYCIVPYARGREVYRNEFEILAEIDKAIQDGFKEVVLIGQSVNSYNKGQFPKLLEKVAQKKLEKVSFISSNPWDFSDELIEVIAKNKNIDRLIHLPLQSGDDEVLKRMNRGYTAKDYLKLVEKIKNNIPGVRLSTDIIIGFPGEDEKAFENTVSICRKVGFKIAYLNKYSPRKGTVSAKIYKDEISQKEKKRRWVMLDNLVNKKLS